LDVRKATASDIEAAVSLAERHRRQYQKYQPTFWRKAADSAKTTKSFFASLLAMQDTLFLIAVEGDLTLGFLIARKFPTPPIYAPGGDTWIVDDFCVAEPHHWLSAGEALLSHATTVVHEHGAVQIVVVCGERDLAKAEMLRRSDLTIASNWWTRSLH
jgi:GNAT superfamily N-acetyltransferase